MIPCAHAHPREQIPLLVSLASSLRHSTILGGHRWETLTGEGFFYHQSEATYLGTRFQNALSYCPSKKKVKIYSYKRSNKQLRMVWIVFHHLLEKLSRHGHLCTSMSAEQSWHGCPGGHISTSVYFEREPQPRPLLSLFTHICWERARISLNQRQCVYSHFWNKKIVFR